MFHYSNFSVPALKILKLSIFDFFPIDFYFLFLTALRFAPRFVVSYSPIDGSLDRVPDNPIDHKNKNYPENKFKYLFHFIIGL